MSDAIAQLNASLVGRYHIEREIGRGGMATVYLAEDLKHGRRVAIKVVDLEPADSARARRFLREIRIAANLNHPHISPLFDSGEAAGALYYVMPLMEGESLRSALAREGSFPVDRAISIALDVAEALGHAHQLGIVHRDVKPGNILLVGDHAVLADFGIARAMEAAWGDLTATGLTLGTPLYMSPEQLSGEGEADARSDLYALACVLYEMLAGQRPFSGKSPMAVLARQMSGPPTPLESLRSDAPPGLASAIRRALSKEPRSRPQTAAEFAEAVKSAERPGRESSVWALIFSVVASALILVASITFLWPGANDLTDQEGSVVILPFRDAIQTPEEDSLVVELADELTRQLNRWDSIRAVPQLALSGVSFDLGVEAPILTALDDGHRIAETVGVETLLILHARIRGDSAEVTATRFIPGDASPRGPVFESRGPRDDPFVLAAEIAHDVLGLSGPVDAVERLRRQSSSVEALVRYSEGLRLLERWRLTEAESALRRATASDSTFAMAHHYLAVNLYLQTAGTSGARLSRLGPEAARHSRAALRYAADLPLRERSHVIAYSRFLEGDYETARQEYAGLLARDSTDVYAWLLGGLVELTDPWLEERPDGSSTPRADWNAAVRHFTESTRLSPDFHLGYGYLFEVSETVLATTAGLRPRGLGRYLPRDELIPPWQPLNDPRVQEAFYPVYRDSLHWLTGTNFDAAELTEVAEGAGRLLDRSLRTLRRWAAYSPDEPRPHAELAHWTLRQRAGLQPPVSPVALDSLASVARDHAERALSVTNDTLPSDLVMLANLHLATGESERAVTLLDETLEKHQVDDPLPRSTANVLLHGGRWRSVLALMDDEPVRSFYVPDPVTGELLGDGGAEPLVRRLAVLGSVGVEGPELREAFQQLEDRWSLAPAGTASLPALRALTAPRIAPALVAAPEILARWRAEAHLTAPFWEAVDPGSTAALAPIRATAFATQRIEGVPTEPTYSYLLGTAALRAGDPMLALRLFAHVDSIPLAVEDRDLGWALRALVLFRRGEAYEVMGDRESAAEMFREFLGTRSPGDGTAPYEAAARTRLGAAG